MRAYASFVGSGSETNCLCWHNQAMKPRSRLLLALAPLAVCFGWMDGEAPLKTDWDWSFEAAYEARGFSTSPATPGLQMESAPAYAPAAHGGGLVMNGDPQVLVVATRAAEVIESLPREALTASAWVAIERPQRWGGILSCIQDNGEYEKGFVLGYDDEVFTFGLATTGADDGDGRLSYFRGRTAYRPGAWHHVAATFDGKATRIYVDGKLDFESTLQTGEVLYDLDAPVVIGAYRDKDENYPLDGRLREVKLESRALGAIQVEKAAQGRAVLPNSEPWTDMEFGFLVEPYLTWPRLDGVSILFESSFPSSSSLSVWRDDQTREQAIVLSDELVRGLHEYQVRGLQPDQKYFYQANIAGLQADTAESPVLSFRTAASVDRAYTFAVVGDTQTNGEVAKRVSDLAYMHRPNFIVHAGDLVDTGSSKRDWTDTFFPSMQPLLGRVPIIPVLGNHEQDAKHYYDYMSLPDPERWYSTVYGNAEFFMIDGNRSLAQQSEQLQWLEGALKQSTATWRFAVLHQPPYTSDSNDYGDTLIEASTRGDMNVRNIVGLLEKYGVDVCFSGHVHDYERTFPIRAGKVTPYQAGGVIYVTAAGGGGGLEDFDPTNTWFGHKKARYHHFVYVAIHGTELEFQAIDEQGRLFDLMTLQKRGSKR
jgi:acid phosphatase type 7